MMENGYSLSDIVAALGNNRGNGNNGDGGNNNDPFGANGGIWIIILLLFFGRGFGLTGNGGGGQGYSQPIVIDGGKGFGGCGGSPCATQADLSAAFASNATLNGINGIDSTLCQGFNGIQQSLTSGFAGVDRSVCTLGYNMQTGFNGLSREISDCCCKTDSAIQGLRYDMATQACDTRNTIHNSTRDIIDNANANSRAILDFLTQDKIATLTAENQSLKFAASQSAQNAYLTANNEAQTAELIRRLGLDRQTCPIPAYVVPNPNCCYNYNVQPGCNSGCNGGF